MWYTETCACWQVFTNTAIFYKQRFLSLQIISSRQKLPEDRTSQPKSEFGYLEPETIRPGRFSIRQALTFLAEHKSDPDEVGSAESIARRYNLNVQRVNNILTHFGVFNLERTKSLTEGAKNETQFSVKVTDTAGNTYKQF